MTGRFAEGLGIGFGGWGCAGCVDRGCELDEGGNVASGGDTEVWSLARRFNRIYGDGSEMAIAKMHWNEPYQHHSGDR